MLHVLVTAWHVTVIDTGKHKHITKGALMGQARTAAYFREKHNA